MILIQRQNKITTIVSILVKLNVIVRHTGTGKKKLVEAIVKPNNNKSLVPTLNNTNKSLVPYKPNYNLSLVPYTPKKACFPIIKTNNENFTSIIPVAVSVVTPSSDNNNPPDDNYQDYVNKYNVKDLPVSIEPKKIQYTKLNGEFYETSINKNTKATDLTNDHLHQEMSIRNLSKTTLKENTSVDVTTEKGEVITVGKSSHKFSVLGQAYSELYDKNNYKEVLTNNMGPLPENPKIILAVILPEDGVFMPSAKQKHLLCVYSENEDKYYIIGYLTSKKTSVFFSEQQFKDFINENKGIVNTNGKTQYIHILDNAESISKEKLTIIKGGEEYFDKLTTDVFCELKKSIAKLKDQPLLNFNFSGISKDKCLEICKMYDENCKNKSKHPLSKEQENINQQNKIKTEEENKKKKALQKDNNKEKKTFSIYENKTT